MDYRVARDNERKTFKQYMENQTGIPTAFVVGKDGLIAWRGHPLELDNVIKDIMAGNFDLDKQKKISGIRKQMQAAMQTGDIKLLTRLAENILSLEPEDNLALRVRMMLFERQQQADRAVTFLEKMIEKKADSAKLHFLLMGMVKQERRREIAEKIFQKFAADGDAQIQLATVILAQLLNDNVPLDIALEAARKAVDLNLKDEAVKQAKARMVLAKAYYAIGLFRKAVAIQEKAIKDLDDEKARKKAVTIRDFYLQAQKLHEKEK